MPDSIYHFSTTTFTKLGSQAVGKDPHLFHLENINRLFVACQSGDLYIFNGENLNEISVLPLTGAHGIYASPDQNYVYLSNVTGSDLYSVNATSGTLNGSAINAIEASPHNIVVNMAGNKMFVTHSGPLSNKVTVYTISNGNIVVREVHLNHWHSGLSPQPPLTRRGGAITFTSIGFRDILIIFSRTII